MRQRRRPAAATITRLDVLVYGGAGAISAGVAVTHVRELLLGLVWLAAHSPFTWLAT